MVILDTNILIDHLRLGDKSKLLISLFEKYKVANLSMCMATVQELFAGTSSRQQEDEILNLIASLKVWPYSHDVAKLAGEIERDVRKDIEFADAVIAATCVMNDCQLATINKKDFSGIGDLQMANKLDYLSLSQLY